MVDAISSGVARLPITPNSAVGRSVKIVQVQATPEQTAQLGEAERRAALLDAVDREYKEAWARKGTGAAGMQLGDVSKQSPQQAAGNLAAITKLRDIYGENGIQISASRGDEMTTSVSTFMSWLQERAGAAQANDLNPASLFSLKV
ncbi:hypothetical protein [uncultured Caulobacter sp.]|uniref:hypothetical protein n=1 Tax=uncultured Caulobacter sp. TaxID=158749 RepID=UPI002637CBE6|nr:hypothetical protein [uncultured Caulobacter sp.]